MEKQLTDYDFEPVEYDRVNLSDEAKANLLKLADFLDKIPKSVFDMEYYAFDPSTNRQFQFPADWEAAFGHPTVEQMESCGTVCCALGYAPIVLEKTDFAGTYDDFGEEYFGLETVTAEWDWCFDTQWAEHYPTPQDAATRIRFMVMTGRVPSDWDMNDIAMNKRPMPKLVLKYAGGNRG